jgi:hypothetical protein
MNPFVYEIPTKVYFGENQLEHLGPELARYGQRVLLTYGGGSIKATGLYDRVVAEVRKAGLTLFEMSGIEPNPRVTSVRKGAEICRREKIDVLLAVGGGSTLDCTKFIGAAAFYDGDAWDLSTGAAQIAQSLPIVTVLTLSATGSEMDTGGVITNLDTQEKLGNGHPVMVPKVSFLDPTNTYTVDAYQTACGAADILSHTLEVYCNTEPDLELLDGFMEHLMRTVVQYAHVAQTDPTNYEARANLMWASSWAINGFIVGGKRLAWSCHPMEHEVSAVYDITHGLGLAILTPRWMEFCLDAHTAPRLKRFAVNVFGVDPSLEAFAAARLGIAKLSEFYFQTLGLASTFTALGIDRTHFAHMASRSCGGGVLPGFRPLDQKAVETIFEMCL